MHGLHWSRHGPHDTRCFWSKPKPSARLWTPCLPDSSHRVRSGMPIREAAEKKSDIDQCLRERDADLRSRLRLTWFGNRVCRRNRKSSIALGTVSWKEFKHKSRYLLRKGSISRLWNGSLRRCLSWWALQPQCRQCFVKMYFWYAQEFLENEIDAENRLGWLKGNLSAWWVAMIIFTEVV